MSDSAPTAAKRGRKATKVEKSSDKPESSKRPHKEEKPAKDGDKAATAPKRGRGRPKKVKRVAVGGRGRPKKAEVEEKVVDASDVSEEED